MQQPTILVTDAVAAAGRPPERTIGGVTASSRRTAASRYRERQYLAGPALTLDRAIANTVRFTGLPIDAVMKCVDDPCRLPWARDRWHGDRRLGSETAALHVRRVME